MKIRWHFVCFFLLLSCSNFQETKSSERKPSQVQDQGTDISVTNELEDLPRLPEPNMSEAPPVSQDEGEADILKVEDTSQKVSPQKKTCCVCEYKPGVTGEGKAECNLWRFRNSFRCDEYAAVEYFEDLPHFEGCTDLKHAVMKHGHPDQREEYLERIGLLALAYKARNIESRHYGCRIFEDYKEAKKDLQAMKGYLLPEQKVSVTANQAWSLGYYAVDSHYKASITKDSDDVIEEDFARCNFGGLCLKHGQKAACKNKIYTEKPRYHHKSNMPMGQRKFKLVDSEQICCYRGWFFNSRWTEGSSCEPVKCEKAIGDRCFKKQEVPCMNQNKETQVLQCCRKEGKYFGRYCEEKDFKVLEDGK